MQTRTIQHGNATIVISRPELTEAERAKREAKILLALQQFGKAMVDAEKSASA